MILSYLVATKAFSAGAVLGFAAMAAACRKSARRKGE